MSHTKLLRSYRDDDSNRKLTVLLSAFIFTGLFFSEDHSRLDRVPHTSGKEELLKMMMQYILQAGYPSCLLTNIVKALKEKCHISWTCSPQAQPGVFQLCRPPGYLGEGMVGCLASHQPSDANTPLEE